MTDDEFDALLRDAAHTYNVPLDPPRDAMWHAIARARSAAAVTPVSTRRAPRWIAAAAGIAAVLMAGIIIGRASRGPADAPTIVASSSAPVTPPVPSPSVDSGQEVQPSGPRADAAAAAPVSPSTSGRTAAVRRLAAGNGQRGAPRDGSAADLSNDGMAYRLAVVEHLTRTEVLLTSYRAQDRSSNAARVDAQFAALSRELLGTTRLLLATRRGEDPAITRLLQDLEYVLMQLSQYANDGRPIDRDAIDQSLDKRNVIPKLRATIPAGASASAGT